MKKNVASKILAGALASTMVLSMAACGGSETTDGSGASSSTPSSSNSTPSSSTPSSSTSASDSAAAPTAEPAIDMSPLSITISLPSDEVHSEPNEWYDKLVKDLNDYTQMDITWEWLPQADYYNVLGNDIVAGNVADVMVVGKDATFLGAAQDGLFWDLTDYLDDYDNFATIPDATLANAAHQGRVYGIPRSRTYARQGMGYRVDWLNNKGLAEPTDWDSFVEMLRVFTYEDPDGDGVDNTVGLFLDSWTGAWDIMMTWFGVPNTWGLDENGDLIHKSQTEEYKTALAAFRELYAEGLINNGANNIKAFTEYKAGRARNDGLRTQIGGCGIQVLDDLRKVQTYFEGEGITTEEEIIFTLAAGVDTGLGIKCLPTTGMNNMIAISTKTVKTEAQLRRVLQCLNDLNDGEALNLIEYGWMDLTYNLDENGYVHDFTTDELAASGVQSKKYSNGFNQVPVYFTAEENARPVVRPPASSPITILENKLYEENLQYCVDNLGAAYSSQFEVDNSGALAEILSQAQNDYITGVIDEAGLDEAIQRWWKSGGRIVTAEMNAAYHADGK